MPRGKKAEKDGFTYRVVEYLNGNDFCCRMCITRKLMLPNTSGAQSQFTYLKNQGYIVKWENSPCSCCYNKKAIWAIADKGKRLLESTK